MSAVDLNTVVSGLQTVAGGQPRALSRLVTQYAQHAALQLVPAELAGAAAALPLDFRNGHLAFDAQKLAGAFGHVLGTLSPQALQTLQRITQVLPGGLPGLLDAPADFLHKGWFEQVGRHLLREALGPQLQQFAQTGRQALLGAAGQSAVLAQQAPTTPDPGAGPPPVAPASPEAAAPESDDGTADQKQPAAGKPPVKTGWLDWKKEHYEQLLALADQAKAEQKGAVKLPPRGKLYGMIAQHLAFFKDYSGTFGMSRGDTTEGAGLMGIGPSRTRRFYNGQIHTDSLDLAVNVGPFSTNVNLVGGQEINLGVGGNAGVIGTVLNGLSAASVNPMVIWQLQALKKILPGDFKMGAGGVIEIGQSQGKWYTRLSTTRKFGYEGRGGVGGSLTDMRSIQLTEDHFKYLGFPLPHGR